MGKIDAAMYMYMSDKSRIADLFNGVYFRGNQLIRSEDIEDYAEKYPLRKKKQTGNARYRDIVKKLKNGGSLRVLAIENQNCVDYTMPFRCMEYDTLEYRRQISRKKQENQSVPEWNNKAEFLCGIHRTDRFAPVYTICLYHGEGEWDGPRSLRDMMDFGEDRDRMSDFFNDYPMRLFCINEVESFDCFRTELREFFTILSYRNDAEKLAKLSGQKAYENISRETAETIAVVLGWPEPENVAMKYSGKGDEVNMCKALEELLTREREIGEKTGMEQNMRDIIIKMRDIGIEMDKICQVTGKTQEEVQQYLS